MLLNFCLPVFLALFGGVKDTLIVYPEYPAVIERDKAYKVTVTQGEVTKPLVVYNHCEKSTLTTRIHGGDVNRRFCEFAFSGKPVRALLQKKLYTSESINRPPKEKPCSFFQTRINLQKSL